MSLWGGRFAGKSDPLFTAFNDSLPFDRRLVHADIFGSIAWAKALCRAGIITATELSLLTTALTELDVLARTQPHLLVESKAEDVHSWVESELIGKVGDLGKKLHTGRSRNDQVATDIRLWTHQSLAELIDAATAARLALINLAQRELGDPKLPAGSLSPGLGGPTVIPGYTHLQRGQPILFSHWALAYAEMLGRDITRFQQAQAECRQSPLGSGALAGTAFPIDRAQLALDLGLDSPCANSLDAVSDRDFAFTTLASCALCGLHLSRLAEDLILYITSEFGFVQMDDSVTSGSSLMPQKKNPDAMELIRGKTGRLLGNLTSLAVTLKGLPLAYNKDMQEDKEPLFDSVDHLLMSLRMTVPVIERLRVDKARCAAAAIGDGTVLATDLADYLVDRGMPFRTAHEIAGKAVRLTLASGTPLHKLSLGELNALLTAGDPPITDDVYAALTLDASLARRRAIGGTSPERVAEAIAAALAVGT